MLLARLQKMFAWHIPKTSNKIPLEPITIKNKDGHLDIKSKNRKWTPEDDSKTSFQILSVN